MIIVVVTVVTLICKQSNGLKGHVRRRLLLISQHSEVHMEQSIQQKQLMTTQKLVLTVSGDGGSYQ